jgi:hypothetical protein
MAQNPWGLRFQTMFHMSGDSDDFRREAALAEEGWALEGTVFVREGERYLPLYVGKTAHHYDARFSTYEGATDAQIRQGTLPRLNLAAHTDPSKLPLPRYWVPETLVDARLAPKPGEPKSGWPHGWVLGWRDVCRSADVRTIIPSVLPRIAVGHKFPLMHPRRDAALLLANMSSIVLDYSARQKYAGASLAYFVLEQLPVLAPDTYDKPVTWLNGNPPASWIRDRVLELTYTSYEMAPWAQHLGEEGPPFVWDEDRRFVMRAELDAAYFHLYGIAREDLPLVMDSFRAFRNKTPELFHATCAEITRVYDAMAKGPYATELTPPPAHSPRHPPGTSPLTRPRRPHPEPPGSGPGSGASPDEPPSDGGLFSLGDIGQHDQLRF